MGTSCGEPHAPVNVLHRDSSKFFANDVRPHSLTPHPAPFAMSPRHATMLAATRHLLTTVARRAWCAHQTAAIQPADYNRHASNGRRGVAQVSERRANRTLRASIAMIGGDSDEFGAPARGPPWWRRTGSDALPIACQRARRVAGDASLVRESAGHGYGGVGACPGIKRRPPTASLFAVKNPAAASKPWIGVRPRSRPGAATGRECSGRVGEANSRAGRARP